MTIYPTWHFGSGELTRTMKFNKKTTTNTC
jgi:hypothetical protein